DDAFYVDNQMERSDAAGDDSLYEVAVVRLSSTEYTVTAAPLNLQLKDTGCNTYSLTSEGLRGSTGSLDLSECW
ncbi:MAG: hypothetical protein HKN19_14300, partial [Halioglobus sp.]|nr:hypothetical protein [Halioglobus sp.]